MVGDLGPRCDDGAGGVVAPIEPTIEPTIEPATVASIVPGAPILLLGGSGPVGKFLIDRLAGQGVQLMAVSRRQPIQTADHVIWVQHDLDQGPLDVQASVLVSLGPLRHVLDQVRAGRRIGRVIALSSASTLFKMGSSDPLERALMTDLAESEQALNEACRAREIELTLLKPAMIYGTGQNANVERLAGLMGRLRMVPYCGRGLRQPVHADDLARLIVGCIIRGRSTSGTWVLGGGETLDYRAMLVRIASARGQRIRPIQAPALLIRAFLGIAHSLGRMRDIRPVMIERQRLDLVVDDSPARENLDWNPRPFRP